MSYSSLSLSLLSSAGLECAPVEKGGIWFAIQLKDIRNNIKTAPSNLY